MKYLLDANVFIDAKNRYYGFDIAPVFWQWILSSHAREDLYSIRAVHAELRNYEDELSVWVANTVPSGFFCSLIQNLLRRWHPSVLGR